MENNKITLIGKVVEDFKYDYTVLNEDFYSLYVEVQRESGKYDKLNVICSDRLIDTSESLLGSKVLIEGSIRTYNDKDGETSHLRVYVFAEDISIVDNEIHDENIVYLDGYLCKKQDIRQTPFGRTITDATIACNSKYGKSYYIPSIFWGRNARYVNNINVGTEMQLTGRLQSRNYTKDDTERTAYELSIQRVDIV